MADLSCSGCIITLNIDNLNTMKTEMGRLKKNTTELCTVYKKLTPNVSM